MRDHWMELATGQTFHTLIPRDEALPQVELLAELAASGSDQTEDWLMLLVAYQVRVEALERNRDASQGLTRQAVEQEDIRNADRWSSSVAEFEERLRFCRAKISALLTAIFSSNDTAGSARLISALSAQADRGDERAVGLLQVIMDSVTPQRGQAIRAEVRKLEGAAEQ
jgi:hypothetical protein